MMKAKRNMLVLAGAMVGGTLGYFVFFWVLRQGLYGLVIPGGLLGFGAAWVRGGSKFMAVVCGVAALALSLFCEWRAFPFSKDDSFGYFIAHLHQLRPMTMLMIGVGTFIAFWLPYRGRNLASSVTDAPTQ
jgi:hypothetical protein